MILKSGFPKPTSGGGGNHHLPPIAKTTSLLFGCSLGLLRHSRQIIHEQAEQDDNDNDAEDHTANDKSVLQRIALLFLLDDARCRARGGPGREIGILRQYSDFLCCSRCGPLAPSAGEVTPLLSIGGVSVRALGMADTWLARATRRVGSVGSSVLAEEALCGTVQ